MQIKHAVCPHDCPDTCGWQVTLNEGRITRVSGDPANPVTRGIICAKAAHYPERIYGKERVLYPFRRTGPKGIGEFKRISWSEALTEIVERFQDMRARHGAECILPYSYAGTEGVVNKAGMDRRFFFRLGASNLERTICSDAGSKGYNLVYGQGKAMNPLDTVNARLIIFWGINALETNLHQALLADEARRRGAKIVVIDVHRNRTARWADDFYQILPGSDGALALGLVNLIWSTGLADTAWAKEHTEGLDELLASAKDYTPQRVAQLTGLSPERVTELARLYATTKPSLIRIGNGLQHHDNGGMSTRAIACLPSITGAWQDKGGGVLKFNSGYFPLNKEALQRPDLLPNPVRSINMNQLGRALTELNPPVYGLYVYNSNPAAVAPEQTMVRRGLAREDLFTVVHEQVWSETARWADIVLPATTALEHADLYVSYWHTVLQWAEPVIEPLGESRPNIEVFRALAEGFGFQEECFKDSVEDMAAQALDLPYWRNLGIDVPRVKQERFIALPAAEIPFKDGGFPTSSGKAELAGELAEKEGYGRVPRHVPLVEGPETANELYPLTLISPPNHQFLNSTFAELPSLKRSAGEPRLEIHPADAVKRGIVDGQKVEVYNERGKVILRAVLKDSVLPGVVVAAGVWQPYDYPGGFGINALTPDRLSDMGNGATFFSNLVEIKGC